ncbi:serine/threonine protein phosphatase [Tsuneonella sp. YG55]|uniref:Serine/threonine protein phosphatase n=1 Tax=Tsuneonella litorea TaxID=2976475 RepID=A0A9X3AL74_9SPHN|nr:metallophosphoesterase family protein [Tsuneonella litorea]MCT2558873.1 serine/threonine protein phosphatase [Tsuneonella litorea]
MFEPLRQIFRSRPAPVRAAVPAGERYYAVGDIHGRRDLFAALVDAIEADGRGGGAARSTAVLLGDLIDRGPDSAGVVELAMQWSADRPVELLAGNHEEMFLESFEDEAVLRHFLRHGGRETVLSYGIEKSVYDGATLREIQSLMHEAVPAAHRAFLAAGRDNLVAGDYLFVHAGIAPNVPLAEQKQHHFRWIREPFLDHDAPHEHFVVHGHTITQGIDVRTNRLGIDTGAYRTGRLTALVLEGEGRRIIQAVETDGEIAIETGDCDQ